MIFFVVCSSTACISSHRCVVVPALVVEVNVIAVDGTGVLVEKNCSLVEEVPLEVLCAVVD